MSRLGYRFEVSRQALGPVTVRSEAARCNHEEGGCRRHAGT
jgi:hypothetical protein